MSKSYFQGLCFAAVWCFMFLVCGCEDAGWKADSCHVLVQQTTYDEVKPAEENAILSDSRCLWLDKYHYLETPLVQSVKNEVLSENAAHFSGKNQRKSRTKNEISSGECVDINEADVSQLTKLPGVGQGRASQIIQAREKKAFKRKSDIMRIKGIGKKSYRKMASYICEIM